LEEGAATPNANGLDFSYTATQSNASLAGTTIRAVAEDLPRNELRLKDEWKYLRKHMIQFY
jgi:hypothetical protein